MILSYASTQKLHAFFMLTMQFSYFEIITFTDYRYKNKAKIIWFSFFTMLLMTDSLLPQFLAISAHFFFFPYSGKDIPIKEVSYNFDICKLPASSFLSVETMK